jgi:shikimate dehydrogenase
MKKETGLLGIFGWPLALPYSPAFQNAALKSLGLPALYLPFPVEPKDFARRFKALARLPQFWGANVTLPHKVAAWKLTRGNWTPEARAIGAVNTLYKKNGRWRGHNSDAEGLVLSLKAAGLKLKGKRVLVLGAGGSARAAAYGMLKAGASLALASRRAGQARALARRFADLGPCQAHRLEARGLGALMQQRDLIINTVPGREFAAQAAAALKRLKARTAVCDISYGTKANPLLRAARSKGFKALDGLGMLLEQGALSFSLWTGRRAPKAVMRRALAKAS